jgi:hypothetical protein
MQPEQLKIRRLFLEEFVATLIDICTPKEMRSLIERQIHSPGRMQMRRPRRISVDEQVRVLERTFVPEALAIEEEKSINKINKFVAGAPPKPGKEYLVSEKPLPLPKIPAPRPMPPMPLKRPVSQMFRPGQPKPQIVQKSVYGSTSGMGGVQADRPILIGGDFGFQDSEKIKYILFLLNDPSVQSIECPGLGKQVLLNKSGSIQASNISLNKEEIEGMIQSISKKTKVPVTPGLFKAAFDNFLVTAVISEYAGTRFVIQKTYSPPSPIIPR